ncbi:MAG: T9SS type A sorting domain-containing protein [Salibacteraceae bacterium]
MKLKFATQFQHHYQRSILVVGVAIVWYLIGAFGVLQAQAPFPDLNQEAPSSAFAFVENLVQVLTQDQQPKPSIKYYTIGTFPRIWVHQTQATAPETETDDIGKISFTWADLDTAGPNALHRIDLSFVGPNAQPANLEAKEQASGLLNFYKPHLGPNGATGAKRHSRIELQEVYPKIDFHLYSSELGPKFYLRVQPGGNPNDVRFKFDGQDNLTLSQAGELEMHLNNEIIKFPFAIPYQLDGNGNPVPLGWVPVFQNHGNGEASFFPGSVGAYDQSKDLLLQFGGGTLSRRSGDPPPVWSTYLGADGDDEGRAIVNNGEDLVFVGGITRSSSFPVQVGSSGFIQDVFAGVQDGFVSCFTDEYKLEWSTYIGGFDPDFINDLAYTPYDNGQVYAVGYSNGSSYPSEPLAGAHQEFYPSPSKHGVLTRFKAADGVVSWSTLLGGKNTEVRGVDVHPITGDIYVVGATTNNEISNVACGPSTNGNEGFPICNSGLGYSQNFNAIVNAPLGDARLEEGFIMRFNRFGGLLHSTLFGGHRRDEIQDVAVNDQNVYVVGRTDSPHQFPGSTGLYCTVPGNGFFPLCDGGNGAYFRVVLNSIVTPSTAIDGFIAKFNTDLALQHNTYFGGMEADGLSDIAITSTGEPVAVGGSATNVRSQYGNCDISTNDGFPTCTTRVSYNQNFGGGQYDAFEVKFDANMGLSYCNWVGGEGNEVREWSTGVGVTNWDHEPQIALDDQDNAYVHGTTFAPTGAAATSFPSTYASGFYHQASNSDAAQNGQYGVSDGFLVGLNSSDALQWSSYFGGVGQTSNFNLGSLGDMAGSLTVLSTGKIFLTGTTYSTDQFPLGCPNVTGNEYCVANPLGVVAPSHSSAYVSQINTKGWPLAVKPAEKGQAEGLHLFPNPASDQVVIEWEAGNGTRGGAAIALFDLSGKTVQTVQIDTAEGPNRAVVALNGLRPGVYVVQVNKGQEIISERLMVLGE